MGLIAALDIRECSATLEVEEIVGGGRTRLFELDVEEYDGRLASEDSSGGGFLAGILFSSGGFPLWSDGPPLLTEDMSLFTCSAVCVEGAFLYVLDPLLSAECSSSSVGERSTDLDRAYGCVAAVGWILVDGRALRLVVAALESKICCARLGWATSTAGAPGDRGVCGKAILA